MTPFLAFVSAAPAVWLAQQLADAWDDTRRRRLTACEHRSVRAGQPKGEVA